MTRDAEQSDDREGGPGLERPKAPEQSKTAAKILDVLVEMSDGESTTPQMLAARLKMNRTVTQRLLTTLLARGFVRKNAGNYVLAPRVRTLADAVMPRLRAAVEPAVIGLSSKVGETVVFQVRDGIDVVVLAEECPRRSVSVQVRHEVGSKSPIEASASGLAILAASAPEIVERMAAEIDPPHDLLDRVAEFARTGFATSTGDLQAGVSGLAVSVGSPHAVVGSLAILVPSARVAELDGHRRDLLDYARRIEAVLSR